MKFLMPNEVPNYDTDLTGEDAVELVRSALSKLKVEYDVSWSMAGVSIMVTDIEDRRSEISIPARLFQPAAHGFAFPLYLLERSTMMRTRSDYFGENEEYNSCIVNQNKMIYMILQQNAEIQNSFEDNSIDFILTSTEIDVRNLMSACEFRIQNSYNATKKAQHAMIVVSPFRFNAEHGVWEWERIRDSRGPTDRMFTLGYHIGNGMKALTERDMMRLMRDLPIHPTSESMLSTSNKLIVKPYTGALYKAAGFGYYRRADGLVAIDTLFEAKVSIPSRLKTHVLADAFIAHMPDTPIDSRMPDDDQTIKNAIVAFVPFDQDTLEYVAGELDISSTFASNLQKRIIRRTMVKPSVREMQIFKKPEFYDGDYEVVLGRDAEGRNIILSGFDRIDIVEVKEFEDQGFQVVAECWRPIGCGRLYSQTGLKGVSKVRPDRSMPTAIVTLGDGRQEVMNIDIVAGMNSVKAKHNTIRHAMAALAVKLGLHTGDKFDGLNEQQVNDLSDKIGFAEMHMPDGSVKQVIVGLVQVSQNESAYMFSEEKLQKMSPEGVKYLANSGALHTVKAILQDEESGNYPVYLDDYINQRAAEIRG